MRGDLTTETSSGWHYRIRKAHHSDSQHSALQDRLRGCSASARPGWSTTRTSRRRQHPKNGASWYKVSLVRQYAATSTLSPNARLHGPPSRTGSVHCRRGAWTRRITDAGMPSLRAMERQAAGDLPRRTLTLALRKAVRLPPGCCPRSWPAACHATGEVTVELTAARDHLDASSHSRRGGGSRRPSTRAPTPTSPSETHSNAPNVPSAPWQTLNGEVRHARPTATSRGTPACRLLRAWKTAHHKLLTAACEVSLPKNGPEATLQNCRGSNRQPKGHQQPEVSDAVAAARHPFGGGSIVSPLHGTEVDC